MWINLLKEPFTRKYWLHLLIVISFQTHITFFFHETQAEKLRNGCYFGCIYNEWAWRLSWFKKDAQASNSQYDLCTIFQIFFRQTIVYCEKYNKIVVAHKLALWTNHSSLNSLMRQKYKVVAHSVFMTKVAMPDMCTNHLSHNFSAKHLIQYTKEWFICKWSGSWVGIIESALWTGRLTTNSDLHFDLFPSQSFGMTWKHNECSMFIIYFQYPLWNLSPHSL